MFPAPPFGVSKGAEAHTPSFAANQDSTRCRSPSSRGFITLSDVSIAFNSRSVDMIAPATLRVNVLPRPIHLDSAQLPTFHQSEQHRREVRHWIDVGTLFEP